MIRVTCDVCKRRRSLMKMIPIAVPRDIHSSGGLVVCEDSYACQHLYMNIPTLPPERRSTIVILEPKEQYL